MDLSPVAGSFDSLAAVELSGKIGQALGIDLPGTLAFDYPSVGSISGFLQSKLGPQLAGPSAMHAAHIVAPPPGLAAAGSSPGATSWLSSAARMPAAWGCSGDVSTAIDAISLAPFSRWDLDLPWVSCSTLLSRTAHVVI